MSSTIENIKIIKEHIVYNSITQEFLDINGKDRKHFKKLQNRWYISIKINLKQYVVSCHQFIYYLYHPYITDKLPNLTFIGSYNNLTIENICKKDDKVYNRSENSLTITPKSKIYFNNSKDRDTVISIIKEMGFMYATSAKDLKRKQNIIDIKEIKKASNGLYPIRCETEKWICGNPTF
jgi:hypothetical protein